MAEIAGLVIGGISMAALVDGCMKTFDRIESARTYGRDYQKASLKLSLLKLRLSRWVEGVIETVQQQHLVSIGTSTDAQTVQELLGDIARTIEETERYGDRYQNTTPTLPAATNDKEVATMILLSERVKTMAIHRQNTSSIRQKAQWALRDQRKFKRLLAGLGDSISDLEQLFPAERLAILAQTQQLAKLDASELIHPSAVEEPADADIVVSILEDIITPDVDNILKGAVNKVKEEQVTGHRYGIMNVADSVHCHVGDYVAPGQIPNGLSHSYATLNATGTARIQYGNSYGGKSVFDD